MEIDDGTNRVEIGLETLQTELPGVLKGAKIGLLAHAASRLPTGEHALSVLQNLDLEVVRLFGPEHGFFGAAGAGEGVADAVHDGLPLVSLYGARLSRNTCATWTRSSSTCKMSASGPIPTCQRSRRA